MQNFFTESRINVLDRPGNSPDLNAIENLWAIVKRKLSKHICSTNALLIEAIISIWYHDKELKKMCSNLVQSRPKRISVVLKSKGGYLRY